ncbi:hypothetical protein [Bradyrhizobium sp.]|uniref:hypothetical protein n=1 Tax=Bradyrhizobium sp. TaxID=376 RepID=UPI003C640EC4
MEEYIRSENLKIFRRRLELVKDAAQRQLLLRLLAEEETKAPVVTRKAGAAAEVPAARDL